DELVIKRQHAAAVEGRFERLRIWLAGDVFEQLIHPAAPLQHGIIFLARTNQMRQRKLFARKEKLQRVAEGNLERIIPPARAALHQKFSLLADDQKLGRLARPARELDDRVDDSNVIM